MLSFANVMHLLTNEFARLRRGGLPLARVLSCSFDSFLFWHRSPPVSLGSGASMCFVDFPLGSLEQIVDFAITHLRKVLIP